MPSERSFVAEFALKVFLPSLAASAVVALLFLRLFFGVFSEVNELDRGYARESATAAVTSLKDDLAEIARAGNASAADASFLLDANAKTLAATIDGHSSGLTAGDFFGSSFAAILSAGAPSFVLAGRNMMLVAAERHGDRTFIAARAVTTETLAAVSRRYGLEHLRLGPPGQPGVEVFSVTGGPIATLQWSDRRPGDLVQFKYRDIITAALTSLMFVIGLLIYMSWRGFQAAHESTAKAVAASLQDDLTGLSNRRSLLAGLHDLLANIEPPNKGLSIVYADLDGFKEINDAYGHEAGDQLLRAVAAGFSFLAAKEAIVARFGGDEFGIIVVGPGHAERARQLGTNIIALLSEPLVFGSRIAAVAASIGIVDVDDQTAGAEEVLRRADVAMYAAKNNGRNRIHVYDRSLDKKRDENRAIAAELRAAIEQRTLSVVYQPIVDARTRRVTGVEALVRWPLSSSRILGPDVFVPVAEEFGLIDDLGLFVLGEACRQAANWPHITISVNVSPVQFMSPNFAAVVEKTLQASGLEAKRLEIEVTEGFVIGNADRAKAIIDKLHEMRVSVALDDFGTGYSSIGHLRRFKFDKLKLDRSMVMDILHRPSSLRLVQGAIAMADALGLVVTAEGVEDENQVSVLRLAGCSHFQGYLFSKPVEATAITALLNQPATATGDRSLGSLNL